MYGGSLRPKQWRTSYDTDEIGSIIHHFSPSSSPPIKGQGGRYETSNMANFKDKYDASVREFGGAEARNLRKITEISSPDFLVKDKQYVNIMARMDKQFDINSKEPHAIRRALLHNKPLKEVYSKRHNSIIV